VYVSVYVPVYPERFLVCAFMLVCLESFWCILVCMCLCMLHVFLCVCVWNYASICLVCAHVFVCVYACVCFLPKDHTFPRGRHPNAGAGLVTLPGDLKVLCAALMLAGLVPVLPFHGQTGAVPMLQ